MLLTWLLGSLDLLEGWTLWSLRLLRVNRTGLRGVWRVVAAWLYDIRVGSMC